MRHKLRGVASWSSSYSKRVGESQWPLVCGRRDLQISSTPSNDLDLLAFEPPPISSAETPDARFEVLGLSFPVLSVSLSASQPLYTRRGTLIGVGGKAENAVSTLSLLAPFRRLVLGIPFLYQKISSTTPITALISTKSTISSLAVIRMDGSTDWMLVKRALLAWTGQTLSVKPTVNQKMSLAYMGNSEVTGRGLLALAGRGSIFQISLGAGEDYVAHPGNVVGYTINSSPPSPYRLKSSSFRLRVPEISVSGLLPDTKFFRAMSESNTWRAIANVFYTLRTWSRRTIWGDRLFLQFRGPTTILLQTRAGRLGDILTTRDVNEIADAPAGSLQSALTSLRNAEKIENSEQKSTGTTAINKPPQMSLASVGRDGKVRFESTEKSPLTAR